MLFSDYSSYLEKASTHFLVDAMNSSGEPNPKDSNIAEEHESNESDTEEETEKLDKSSVLTGLYALLCCMNASRKGKWIFLVSFHYCTDPKGCQLFKMKTQKLT